MRAIRENFPGCNLYLTYGPGVVQHEMRACSDVAKTGYGLMTGFFDGLLHESSGCIVTDGYEGAYRFRTNDEFIRAADMIRNQSAVNSNDPTLFRKRTKVGFGIWPVGGDGKTLDTADFTENRHTPEELEYALSYALRNSDGVVWVYGGGIEWVKAPKEYLAAIRNARKPHSLVSPGRAGSESDQTVFAAQYRDYAELYDFPTLWKFRTDPDDRGVKEKWFARGVADADWRPVSIRGFWNAQIKQEYLGYAWYRTEFNLDRAWLNEPLILAFGAVDELGWVYLNGKLVYDHSEGKPAELWDRPFAFDIGKQARAGRNLLVVRVHNGTGPGGIWRGVKLFGPKPDEPKR